MSLKLATVFYLFAVATASRSNHVRKYRMVGGTEAEPHEFPHMVTVDSYRHDPLRRHFCGGGILNENWIITAGHCKWLLRKGELFRINAGKHSLSTVENTEQVINVSRVIVHEQFAGGLTVGPHDIALLKLKQPLVFNEYVKPIALPMKDTKVDGELVFSGWGKIDDETHPVFPDKLQKSNMTVFDLDSCKKTDELLSETPTAITDTMLCTKSPTNSIFACSGDSGSPLIKQDNHNTYLVGIFSWFPKPCYQKNGFSVFTKVSPYVDWIENIMSKN